MKFYAADNRYSSPTDIGFSNTWYVLVFDSRKARDQYVENAEGLAARAITKRDVTNYAANWDMKDNRENRPRPFTGEHWAVIDDFYQVNPRTIPGCIGQVGIADAWGESIEGRVVSRLY